VHIYPIALSFYPCYTTTILVYNNVSSFQCMAIKRKA